jgi:hypothetical protein
MTEDGLTTGGCLCGAVRYRVRGRLRGIVACHCGQCLRQHGNFAAYTNAPLEAVEIAEEGQLAWYESSAEARRGFCRNCGSPLFWQRVGATTVSIDAGSLDQPSGLRLVQHIYVADKADFYEIADGLPQLPGTMAAPESA